MSMNSQAGLQRYGERSLSSWLQFMHPEPSLSEGSLANESVHVGSCGVCSIWICASKMVFSWWEVDDKPIGFWGCRQSKFLWDMGTIRPSKTETIWTAAITKDKEAKEQFQKLHVKDGGTSRQTVIGCVFHCFPKLGASCMFSFHPVWGSKVVSDIYL